MNMNHLSPMYDKIEKTPEVREFLEQNRKETGRWYEQQEQHFANFSYSAGVGFTDAETLFPGESPERVLIRKEAHRALRTLLDSQDEIRLRRLILYFDAGLTFAEIARRESVSEAAVRLQIKRILKDMRLQLQKEGYCFSDFRASTGFILFHIPTKRTQEKQEAEMLKRRSEEVSQKSKKRRESEKIA